MKTIKYLTLIAVCTLITLVSCEKQGEDPGTEAPVKFTISPDLSEHTYSYVDYIELTIEAKDLDGQKTSAQVDVEVENSDGYSGSLTAVSVANGEGTLTTSGTELKEVAKAGYENGLSVAALQLISSLQGADMRWPFTIDVVSAISNLDAPSQGAGGSSINLVFAAETFVNQIASVEIQSKVNADGTYSTIETFDNVNDMELTDTLAVILPDPGNMLYLRAIVNADNALTDAREITVNAIAAD